MRWGVNGPENKRKETLKSFGYQHTQPIHKILPFDFGIFSESHLVSFLFFSSQVFHLYHEDRDIWGKEENKSVIRSVHNFFYIKPHMFSAINFPTLDNLNCAILTFAKLGRSHSDLKLSNPEISQN